MTRLVVDDDFDGEEDSDLPEIEHIYSLTKNMEPEDITDPFARNAEEIKGLSGVSSNQKRKITTLEKRFDGRAGTGSKKLETEAITGYNAFEVITPPYNLDNLAKLFEVSSFHQAAINAKVSNIVGLGYDFVESAKIKRKIDETTEKDALDKLRKKLARAKADLGDLLDTLNEEDTFAEVMIKVWTDYEATGNGYIEIGRIRTGDPENPNEGQIGYVGHVPSTSIRIRKNRDGFVQILGKNAVFFRNFGKTDPNPVGNDTNPNELIHIKKYAPSSSYYGVPNIVAAKQALAGNEFAQRFNLDYFENKAVPRHLIIIKGATLGTGPLKSLMEFFETNLKGQNHRSLVVPLPGDRPDRKVEFKIEPIEANVQDASFGKYRKDNKEEILTAHRVPVSKIGLPEGVSLAAARDADKTFKEQVCGPEQRIFEKKLNRIVKEFTDMFTLKLNELTLTDEATQSQIDERRIKTGQRTPNELRGRDGLAGHPKGDELVDLNAKDKIAAAAARSSAAGNRQRDAQRSAAATDSVGEARNPKGEGRTNGVT